MAGLFDVAVNEEPQDIGVTPVSYDEKQRIFNDIQSQKRAILQTIKDGIAPENILHVALNVIQLLDGDTEFYDKAVTGLGERYTDSAQQSIFVSTIAEETEARRDSLIEYNEKTIKKVKTMLKHCINERKELEVLLMQVNLAQTSLYNAGNEDDETTEENN